MVGSSKVSLLYQTASLLYSEQITLTGNQLDFVTASAMYLPSYHPKYATLSIVTQTLPWLDLPSILRYLQPGVEQFYTQPSHHTT